MITGLLSEAHPACSLGAGSMSWMYVLHDCCAGFFLHQPVTSPRFSKHQVHSIINLVLITIMTVCLREYCALRTWRLYGIGYRHRELNSLRGTTRPNSAIAPYCPLPPLNELKSIPFRPPARLLMSMPSCLRGTLQQFSARS